MVYKYEWKGFFLSEKRARAYAKDLKEKGKKVKVNSYWSGGKDNHPVEWHVMVWSDHPFKGNSFKIDRNFE